MSNIQVLNEMKAKWESLPKQGSAEWLENRKYTIGGSEISIVDGTNLYGSKTNLMQSKLGIAKFEKNVWMKLGNLLEGVVAKYVARELKSEIFEFGSIPGIKNDDGVTIQSYSPDGLTIVARDVFEKFAADNFLDVPNVKPKQSADEYLILLEIKSPGKREPKAKWTKETIGYKSQVLCGLSTITHCDFALFCDAMFRLCEPCDIDYTPNHTAIFSQKELLTRPLLIGAIELKGVKNNRRDRIPDLDLIYDHIDCDKNVMFFSSDDEAKKYRDNVDGNDTIYFWKLYDIKFMCVERDEDFLVKLKPLIVSFLEDVEREKVRILNSWEVEMTKLILEQ